MLDVEAESRRIIEREGGWSDRPPDPPTMYGITLDTWDQWCVASNQKYRTGKRALRAITEQDALVVYRWYFTTQGLAELIEEFEVPGGLIPLLMDMRTQHSSEGCRKILLYAASITGSEVLPLGVRESLITLARVRYLLWLAEGPQKHLRPDVRGLANRALRVIDWWPVRDWQWSKPRKDTVDV